MIAVDTNILLRFVLRDDEAQFIKASAFLEERTSEDPAFVSLIVVAELVWVLRKRYGYSRTDIGTLLSRLLDTEEILFEDHGSLSAIAAEAKDGDLADHLISYSARRAGCSHTVTFDLKAARLVPSMELLS
ncbi:MAG: type II toxin-antitoxin system VapC family toxin [Mesorhizobium sp.]|nr:type II toxin-antitoxin system VapC family toxin [Mesorhizobium sp.]MBL8577816.1 type II toxin-antitoxin system VapC family toxin [Mesorhizobium sp.]